jgi:riboflavin transporter FmnP
MEKSVSKLTPALIGGAVMGVLSSIPIVNLGNCLCCMWVLLGGAVGAYTYKRQLPAKTELSLGEGAVVGLLYGVFGALMGALISYFFMALFGYNLAQSFYRKFLERADDVTPEFRDWMEGLMGGEGFHPILVMISLFFNLIVDSIFGLLGGILGAALFGKKKSGR